jgi:hypothetical protein
MKQLESSRSTLTAMVLTMILMGLSSQSVMAQTELVRDDFTHAALALAWPLSEPCQVGTGLDWQGNGGAPQVAYNGTGELEVPQTGGDRAQFATTIPGSGLALPVTGTITFVCIFNMPAGGHMSIGIHEGDNGGGGWGPSPGGATSTRMFLIDGLTNQINFSDDGNSPGSGGGYRDSSYTGFRPGSHVPCRSCIGQYIVVSSERFRSEYAQPKLDRGQRRPDDRFRQ